jgi:hypothetical protein
MSEKIVGLHGAWRPTPPEPDKDVVAELERLLEAARAGEIVGFVGGFQHRDQVSWSYAGLIGGYGMLGALECLKERMLRMALRRR